MGGENSLLGKNAENLIATEANLHGIYNGALDMSRADIMFSGDKSLNIMDLKNTAGGKASADQVYQVLHYLNDVQI